MSRIGKKPIIIPPNVQVEIMEGVVKVKGPKGVITQQIPDGVLVKQEGGAIIVFLREGSNEKAKWGLIRALLNNCIKGVVDGFEKQLEIKGVGYKANVDGKTLKLDVGFSHEIKMDIPEGLIISVEKNIIKISGFDKQLVGEFAAQTRRVRPPEPYKGKGIRYVGEKVRKKEGKKAAATK